MRVDPLILLQEHHPLTLVSDPDGLLADESIQATLIEQGYLILDTEDPVQLRFEYQQAKLQQKSLLVRTTALLTHLPYDLWQQGRMITLALHEQYPTLDYPLLRELSTAQLQRLTQVASLPKKMLSPLQTQDYLLRHLFDADPKQLRQPASLLQWLESYHALPDSMPRLLQTRLLTELRQMPAVADWPLEQLLADGAIYREFVRQGWSGYVQQRIAERAPLYDTSLPFESDPALQDMLPRLLRTGTLTPLVVEEVEHLPPWARSAVSVDEAGKRLRQINEGLAAIEDSLTAEPLRWSDWQTIAWRWAEALVLRYGGDFSPQPALLDRIGQVEQRLDALFQAWLQGHYALLASRSLPTPHHLYHVPGWLAHHFAPQERVALLVLDGMAVADWLLVRRAWQERRPAWQLTEQLVLAQIPCITSVSRQALLCGRPPRAFGDRLTHNRHDARGWQDFWLSQGLAPNAVAHEHLPMRGDVPYPAAVSSRHTRALCLVSTVIDEAVHGATQGAGDVLASVQIWLREKSSWLEGLIQQLLNEEYRVVLTSDHGHVAAIGMGQPQEGVMVESRSKRARLYTDVHTAHRVSDQYNQTVLWQNDALLPEGWLVLLPEGRRAFAIPGEQVVSHGGLTIEEMAAPLITITQ